MGLCPQTRTEFRMLMTFAEASTRNGLAGSCASESLGGLSRLNLKKTPPIKVLCANRNENCVGSRSRYMAAIVSPPRCKQFSMRNCPWGPATQSTARERLVALTNSQLRNWQAGDFSRKIQLQCPV